MKVVNIFGGPGAGKSTAAPLLFGFLKMKGINAELVGEYAKELLYDGRLESVSERQEYIFAKQHHKIHRLKDQVDYVVVDSPLLLAVAYTADGHPGADHFKNFVKDNHDQYDNYNILLRRNLDLPFQQEGRDRDLEQSIELDQKIEQMLIDWNYPYITVEVYEGNHYYMAHRLLSETS